MRRRRKPDYRTRAALVLDMTLDVDGRGPRTFNARRRLATYLDTGATHKGIASDLRHLESVAGGTA